jgi:hypothetical protein
MAPTRKMMTTRVLAALLRHPDDPTADPGDGADPAADGGDGALGDAGRRALDEERKARRSAERAAREAQARTDELARQVEELTRKSMTDAERQVAEQVEVRSAELRAEIEAQANARILAAETKLLTARLQAGAAGKLTNPADVAVFVNIDDLERDASGDVSDTAIAAAVEALIAERPYLAAKAGAPNGSADQGRRDAPPNFRDRTQLSGELAKLGLRTRS